MRTKKPEKQRPDGERPPLPPSAGRGRNRSRRWAETAKDYARAARRENTRRAYDADWRMFSSWLRRHGLPLPARPTDGRLYLAACAEEASRGAREPRASPHWSAASPASAGAIASWASRWKPRDPPHRHGARRHPPPPRPSARAEGSDIRRRAVGHAGDARDGPARSARSRHSGDRLRRGLRRSEIVGLDCGPGQTEDGTGWIEMRSKPATEGGRC